jgi:hypothetical protein
MLGFYPNFPKDIHNRTTYTTSTSQKRLQQALIETLHKLNSQTLSLEDVTAPSTPNCKVAFEFGVAQDNNFNYLDSQEKTQLLKTIRTKPPKILDFLCAIRYHRIQQERETPLRFDYYMLRFIFDMNYLEMQVYHERGPMHISHKDLPEYLIDKINENFTKKALKPINQP